MMDEPANAAEDQPEETQGDRWQKNRGCGDGDDRNQRVEYERHGFKLRGILRPLQDVNVDVVVVEHRSQWVQLSQMISHDSSRGHVDKYIM